MIFYSSVHFHFYLQELYSKPYSNVGVIFASIPSFSEFYSEDSINKGGIECMRFLNEVISDFDEVCFSHFKSLNCIRSLNKTSTTASNAALNVWPRGEFCKLSRTNHFF